MLTGKRWGAIAIVAMACMCMFGCGVTNSAKQVEKFNGDAADAGALDAEALRPHVDAAGLPVLMMIIRRFKGISAGSRVVTAAIGTPSGDEKYTPENHERWTLVAVSEIERNENMIDAAVGALETAGKWVGGVTGTVALFGAVFAWIKKAREAASKSSLLDIAREKLDGAQKTIGVFTSVAAKRPDVIEDVKEKAKDRGIADIVDEHVTDALVARPPSTVVVAPAPAPEPVPDPAPAPVPVGSSD